MLTFGVSFASCNNIINLIPSIQYLPPTFIYSRSNCFYSFACGTIFLHYIRIDRSYLQRLLNGKIIVLKNMLVKKVHLTKSFFHMFFLIKIVFLTISYLFSIPKNCSNLKFHCTLELLEVPIPHEIVFLGEWGKWGITFSIPRGMRKRGISLFHSPGNEE